MMAICRFSDYRCDLYIYESALGIECYVARSRYENEPEPPPFPAGVDEAEWAQFWRDYTTHQEKIAATRLLPIGQPADGTGEIFGTWGELLAHVRHLKSLGYQVPDWVIDNISEEARTTEPAAGQPWTRRQLQAALRAAGWERMSGPAAVYQSPDDRNVHFHLDRVTAGRGSAWQHYAARRELPSTTRPEFQEA